MITDRKTRLASILVVTMWIALLPAVADAAEVSSDGSPLGAVAIVQAATQTFENAFPLQAECIGNVSVVFENLPGRRGEYRVGLNEIAINPNREIDTMAVVAVHEMAHHLMIACGVSNDEAFRVDFFKAQGLDTGRSWFDYSAGWSATPAEHFAEVVTDFVLGTSTGRIRIDESATQLVARLAFPRFVNRLQDGSKAATEPASVSFASVLTKGVTAVGSTSPRPGSQRSYRPPSQSSPVSLGGELTRIVERLSS